MDCYCRFQELDLSKEALVFADSVRETEWRQECERAVNLIHKDYKYHMVSLSACLSYIGI